MSTATDLEQILGQAEQNVPADAPVLMLNVLRYRPGGREAYHERYLPAFRQVATDVGVEGVEISLSGSIHAALLATAGEHWDAVALVRYPSFGAFLRIARSTAYAERAEPLRTAALADLRLYAVVPD